LKPSRAFTTDRLQSPRGVVVARKFDKSTRGLQVSISAPRLAGATAIKLIAPHVKHANVEIAPFIPKQM
jgi:hypothetical protein